MTIESARPELRAALALVEAQIEGEREDSQIPGISAAVVLDQEVVWARGFGLASLEARTPADPQTIYRIGSITKLFTATMLMHLRDAGKVQLDDPIERYLPEFRIRSRFPDARPSTFRQVASHTAGLPREAPLDYWQTLEFPTFEAILASLADAEMTYSSLTEFKYSNLGVAAIGHALARIAGQSYEEYVAEQILTPLGMHRTGFHLTDQMRVRAAVGYTTMKGKPPQVAPHPDVRGLAPAGQLYSSVEDIARFISLQFRDGPASGAQVLGGATLREMRSPVFMNPNWKGGMAIGWMLGQVADHVTIGHGGGIHGFSTDITLVPDLKLGIAVFTNTGCEPHAIGESVLKVLIPMVSREAIRQARAAEVAAAPEWRKYVGRYDARGLGEEVEVKVVDERLVIAADDIPAGAIDVTSILRPEGGHAFRTRGGPVPGELAVFELDDAGNVARLRMGPFVFERR